MDSDIKIPGNGGHVIAFKEFLVECIVLGKEWKAKW